MPHESKCPTLLTVRLLICIRVFRPGRPDGPYLAHTSPLQPIDRASARVGTPLYVVPRTQGSQPRTSRRNRARGGFKTKQSGRKRQASPTGHFAAWVRSRAQGMTRNGLALLSPCLVSGVGNMFIHSCVKVGYFVVLCL